MSFPSGFSAKEMRDDVTKKVFTERIRKSEENYNDCMNNVKRTMRNDIVRDDGKQTATRCYGSIIPSHLQQIRDNGFTVNEKQETWAMTNREEYTNRCRGDIKVIESNRWIFKTLTAHCTETYIEVNY